MKATLSAATADAMAEDSEMNTMTETAPAVGLAGEGEVLKIHAPADEAEETEAHDSERIRVPFSDDTVRAFIFIRATDGSACAFLNGEHVDTIDDHLSRSGAILAAMQALHHQMAKSTAKPMKAALAQLDKWIAGDLNKIPAGEPCEWPIAMIDDEATDPPTDDSTTAEDSDLNADGDVECAGDVDDGSAVNTELAAPEGDAAVEIVALAGEGGTACGEEEIKANAAARQKLNREIAENVFRQSYSAAKDRYIDASIERANLQISLKEAKAHEAECLEEVESIRRRGVEYLPLIDAAEANAKSGAASTTPAFPSHEPLPPPQAVSEANSPAPPAGDSLPSSTTPAFRDDWQSVDIGELNLPKGVTTKLREAGCETMGKLEAKRGSFDGLMGIDGIGETKKDAIEEAVLGWLSKNRDASVITAVRESAVAGEGVALEMAAQGQ